MVPAPDFMIQVIKEEYKRKAEVLEAKIKMGSVGDIICRKRTFS